jgi:hypothetical protein
MATEYKSEMAGTTTYSSKPADLGRNQTASGFDQVTVHSDVSGKPTAKQVGNRPQTATGYAQESAGTDTYNGKVNLWDK